MGKIGIDTRCFVFRIESFFTFRGKHIRAWVLFVDHDGGAGLHAFCDDGKEAIQIGFIYGYLEGFDLNTCLTLANASGAVKATKFGSGRSVPTFDEVVELLENNGYNINKASKKAGKFINLEL